MKKRISWASQWLSGSPVFSQCVWSPGDQGDQTSLMLVCSSWVWGWSKWLFLLLLWVRQAMGSCAGPHTSHWAVQGCPSTRGAAQTCSGLFWNKQNKDSQNNARGFEILFLFFEQKWGVSRSIHIFQVIIFLSQWQGHIRTDRNGPRNEDLPIILSRAQIFLSHCPHSCCC